MPRRFLLFSIGVVLLACSSIKQASNDHSSQVLVGKWHHVFEEDSPNFKQFRPDGYPVGPARFRGYITFAPEGTLTMLMAAANDAHGEQNGSWRMLDENTLEIEMSGQESVQWTILELTKESLQVVK